MLTSVHFSIIKKFNPKVLKSSYIVIIVFSVFALLAAFQLSLDKLHLLQHPGATLECSINTVLNCASVIKTSQAEVFGFPNSYLGLMGFSAFLFFGLSGLLGVRYNKATLRLLLTGVSFAFVFALWLFFQSLYIIQILCPWCLLTTSSTIFVFAAILNISFRENIFNLSKKNNRTVNKWLDGGYENLFFASLFVLLVILVVAKFGDSLLG